MPWSRALRRMCEVALRKKERETKGKRAYSLKKSVATGDGVFIRGDDMGWERQRQEEVAADVAAFEGPEGTERTTSPRGSMHVTRQGEMHAAIGERGFRRGLPGFALCCFLLTRYSGDGMRWSGSL